MNDTRNISQREFLSRTDIIEASAKAYVDALNRMVEVQTKGQDQELKIEL